MAYAGRAFGRDGPTVAAAAAGPWAATSARFAGGPPRVFFPMSRLGLLRLEPSSYSTLAGQLPGRQAHSR